MTNGWVRTDQKPYDKISENPKKLLKGFPIWNTQIIVKIYMQALQRVIIFKEVKLLREQKTNQK